MALVAGAAALVVQTWAQARLAPTRAAVVMTMEPVFAGAFAVLFGGEVLTGRVLLGGGIVLLAMYLVELGPGQRDGRRGGRRRPARRAGLRSRSVTSPQHPGAGDSSRTGSGGAGASVAWDLPASGRHPTGGTA